MKSIVLTGITGQLGAILAEKYLDKGYKVYGLRRRCSVFNTDRIDHILKDPHVDDRLELVYGDLSDYSSIADLVSKAQPDLFINAGAQSHVRVSFEIPINTADITGIGVLRCLEAIKRFSPSTKFLQCSSSEMFGATPPPQNEETKFHPRSPYASAKVFGYDSVVNYREAYGLFASNAIMFNYEGPTRGETFVTRKITRAVGRIKHGLQNKLYLGNLSAMRDWSHVDDTVDGVMAILDHDKPDDFVIGSGESHSVQEFVELAFKKAGLDDWQSHVEFDKRYLRPTEVDHLWADTAKIQNVLGWKPRRTFEDLVESMVESDLKLAENELLLNTIKGIRE